MEVFGAGFLRDRPLDAVECSLHRCGIGEIQLHAAHVGLVCDGERVQLQHNRETDLFRGLQCLLLGGCDPCFDRVNIVGLKQQLGLVFGQEGAANLPYVADDGLGPAAL